MIRPTLASVALLLLASSVLAQSQPAPQSPNEKSQTRGAAQPPQQPIVNVYPHITVVPNKPTSEEAEQARQDREQDRAIQRTIRNATVVMAVVAIVQFVVGIGAVVAAFKAASAARTSADAVKRTNTITSRAVKVAAQQARISETQARISQEQARYANDQTRSMEEGLRLNRDGLRLAHESAQAARAQADSAAKQLKLMAHAWIAFDRFQAEASEQRNEEGVYTVTFRFTMSNPTPHLIIVNTVTVFAGRTNPQVSTLKMDALMPPIADGFSDFMSIQYVVPDQDIPAFEGDGLILMVGLVAHVTNVLGQPESAPVHWVDFPIRRGHKWAHRGPRVVTLQAQRSK